ncbi:MAG: DUF1801 domain-containing protein [Chloroflexi bacterium]|nr:MAG: DUF1801 domain-containing protein [Chloroflexota bacterium]
MTASRTAPAPSVSEHLKTVPAAVRPTVQAARRLIKAIAPTAMEISYRSQPPRSKSAMWKIIRYTLDGVDVAGIGTFATYASLYFYRGRELEDGSGLLEGGGRDMRFIRLRTPADVEVAATKRIVRKAFTLG